MKFKETCFHRHRHTQAHTYISSYYHDKWLHSQVEPADRNVYTETKKHISVVQQCLKGNQLFLL